MQNPPRMRFTPQVAIVVIVGLIALILPLAMVGFGVYREARNKEISRTAAAIAEGMRQSVESAAEKNLPATGLATAIALQATDPEAEADRIRALVQAAKGEFLYQLPNSSGIRCVVRVPSKSLDAFRSAITGNAAVFPVPEPDETRETIEIEIGATAARPVP